MEDLFIKKSKELSEKYLGKQIAFVDTEVVAARDDAFAIFKEAKKKNPDKKVSLVHIPTGEEIITLL